MGRAHVYKRDHINTDEIIPARYLNTDDKAELARHCFEDLDKDFVNKVKEGDMIVAGEDFGCGSSREHAIWAIRGVKIQTVIAKSFARIFYRNAINNGFYIIESPHAPDGIEDGDELEIDYEKGIIRNIPKGVSYSFFRLPCFALDIINDGGLLNHIINKVRNRIMPDIRKKGLEYLGKVIGNQQQKFVAVSKFYKAEESWTKKPTWWFDLPIEKIESAPEADYYLVCEHGRDKFVVLVVPNQFLLDNIERFDTKYSNVIRLNLAAYQENWLVDERIKNGVDFSPFEVK